MFFFLGSSENTLSLIREKLKLDFPNIEAVFYSPPFSDSFSEDENGLMLTAINTFRPDVLFVGMTAPKQEKWVHENYKKIDKGIVCSIGAVFDFYAGTVKRPSVFWIKMNLEWLIRFIKEPRRLWKRYFIYSPFFLIDVIKSWLKSIV